MNFIRVLVVTCASIGKLIVLYKLFTEVYKTIDILDEIFMGSNNDEYDDEVGESSDNLYYYEEYSLNSEN